MKSTDSRQDDEDLSQVLRGWKVNAPLPPGFQAQVWRKIEARTNVGPAWLEWLGSLSAALSRPALATSYATVLLLVGSATGYWQARSANAQAEAQLSRRYVQMVDPYQAKPHSTH
jgi:hypothetical protein